MRVLVLTAALALAAGPAFAHAGKLDKNGCHQNKEEKVYQCHEGALKDQTFKSKGEAEKAMKSAHSGTKSGQQSSSVPAERKK